MPERPPHDMGLPPRTVYGIYGEGPVTLGERLCFWGYVLFLFGLIALHVLGLLPAWMERPL